MAADQGGSNNVQILGDGNHVNTFISSLKVVPQEVEFNALVNRSETVYVIGLVYAAMALLFMHFSLNFFVAYILFLMTIPFFLYYVEKVFYAFDNSHVTYKDKTLVIKGVERKFYSDIWDVKYRASRLSKAGVLTIYGIDAQKRSPYKQVIKFMYDENAKYIHDLFWNK